MITYNKTLCDARDLLLPGLWSVNGEFGTDFESDIFVNFKEDLLVIKVFRFSTKKSAEDSISINDIENNTYKAEFRPKIVKLFEELK